MLSIFELIEGKEYEYKRKTYKVEDGDLYVQDISFPDKWRISDYNAKFTEIKPKEKTRYFKSDLVYYLDKGNEVRSTFSGSESEEIFIANDYKKITIE